ncbi:MAG: hypothetical protein IKM31_01190 [Oscillospiraceae bacterium]|nr:hypothetical protein [Oscillospiraceae bacterium]
MKKERRSYPILWMFAGFILILTALDFIIPARKFSELENRYLKQSPKFSFSALFEGDYTLNYEGFVNDQFAGRDIWITIKSRAEEVLLKTENNGIVYGKDDRLFEKYTTYNAAQLAKNLGFLEQFAAGQENVTFSVVPSGYVLMEDALPRGLKLADQLPVLAEMEAAVPSAEWIDTRAVLAESGETDLFYRTDHHWRAKGAYLFYAAFCEAKGMTPADEASLPFREVEDFYGTYFSKCKKAGTEPDVLGFYDIPVESVVIDGKEKDGWYDEAGFETRDKYGALMYGNGGLTVLKNGDGDRKLLLVKDSYSNALAPLFLENYDQVYMVDLRSFPVGMQELCETENFEDIIVLYSFSNICSDTNFYRLNY